MSVFGVIVAVTETAPTSNGMYAVSFTGFHAARGTQNHVPTLTTILSIGGAVRVANMFTNLESRLRADVAAIAAVWSGIQKYPLILSLQIRANSERFTPSAPTTLMALFAFRAPFVTTRTARHSQLSEPLLAGESYCTIASTVSPSTVADPDAEPEPVSDPTEGATAEA